MDARENYVMQKESRKEKSICPNCIHHNLCIAENNQPCFECNRFIDANGVTVQEWISVTERLPEHGDVVLCFMKFGEQRILQWDNVSSWWLGYGHGDDWRKADVTDWMPMPNPPKTERRC